MGRLKEYNEIKILEDIYHLRTLTIQQIRNVHFGEKKEYCYKKLRAMKNENLIDSMPFVVDGQKKGASYYITEQGIRRLVEEKVIEKPRRAYDNMPDRKKLKYVIDINELYSNLTNYGYQQIDVRLWKKQHDMDKNSLVKAGLRTLDGVEYGVYLFETDIQEKTFKRFKDEYRQNKQSNKIICLTKSDKAYNKLLNNLDAKDMIREELNIMPYEYGLKVLLYLNSVAAHEKVLTNLLGGTLNGNLKGRVTTFADYVLEKDGQEYYIINYLKMNEIVIHYLGLNYEATEHNNDGRKVIIVCWSPHEAKLKAKFANYPHVAVVSIGMQEIENLLK